MKIDFSVEYELVREYTLDSEGEREMEYTFVVDAGWFKSAWDEVFSYVFKDYDDIEEFLDVYDPELEGEMIYTYATLNGQIKEEGWQEANY